MAKTNFSKMEDSLNSALHKMKVEGLLHLANQAAGKSESQELLERKKLALELKLELKRVSKFDKEIYKKIGKKRKTLDALLSTPADWTEEDLTVIKKAKELVAESIKQLPPDASNDQLVEEERLKHINKRFNVSDRWLPLS